VAARSKVWDCSVKIVGIAGSNTARGMDICLLPLLFLVMERFCAEPIIRPGGSTDCVASLSVI